MRWHESNIEEIGPQSPLRVTLRGVNSYNNKTGWTTQVSVGMSFMVYEGEIFGGGNKNSNNSSSTSTNYPDFDDSSFKMPGGLSFRCGGDEEDGQEPLPKGVMLREFEVVANKSINNKSVILAAELWLFMVTGSLDAAANYNPKYATTGIKAGNVATETAHITKLIECGARVGNLLTGADLGLTALKFAYSDHSLKSQTELTVNLGIAAIGFSNNPVSKGVSVGLGIFETAGGFNSL